MSLSPSIGMVLGHYRILEEIGAGGVGVVYRAHDLQLDRDVAIKVLAPGALDPGARSRFHKEALALARLNHPNVATVHEFGTQDDIDFLVTEYIRGTTLDSRLKAGPLSQAETVELGVQLARGLEAAHGHGVVHRDLKPGNIRLTEEGQLKILDFGLAKLSVRADSEILTATVDFEHGVSGTLPYMAPEQVKGQEVDARSDIWAAGAVLYEMMTGKRPFPATNLPQLIDEIVHQPPKPPSSVVPEIKPSLEFVVLKALDKDPAWRYQSARDLRTDLIRLRTDDSSLQIPSKPAGRYARLRLAITALAALTFLVLVTWYWMEKHSLSRRGPKILAILPFRALSSDDGTGALGAGMTETLTAKLAQTSDREYVQLVSTREIEAQGVTNADQAQREFGADLVLEGSLQRSGSQMRINCILVDANTRRQIGARSITTGTGDIFGLEDQVVNEALNILSAEVPTKHPNMQTIPDTKPQAYEHYLRGLGYLQEYQKAENIQNAITEFSSAIDIDPAYGRAYAGRGEAYWLGFEGSNHTNTWITKAFEDCQKSLAVAPNIAEGHGCMGDVFNVQGEYGKAVEEFKQAVALDSSKDSALRGLAHAYEKQGDLAAAEAAYQQAISLRPQYWAGYNVLGGFYFRQSRYSDAVKMFQRVVELAPGNFRGYSNLGGVLIAAGQYQESIQALEQSIKLRPTLEGYSNLGGVYFALRRFTDAAQIYQRGLKIDNRDSLIWGNLGDALYWTPGRRPEAAAAYHKATLLAEAKLKINPRDATVMAFLATYKAMLDDKGGAVSTVNRALELAPKDAEVRFRSAIVYNHFGEIEQTVSALEQAVGLGYSSSVIRDTPDFDHLRGDSRIEKLLPKK
jgi:eukaryotic-like serine/threonine-protein kinase